MAVKIQEIGIDKFYLYTEIPIAFKVESILQIDLINGGLGGIKMHEENVSSPYIKDYDAYEDGGPKGWFKRFDVSNWGFFLAIDEARNIGGATVAFNSPDVHMLDGRNDLAVLWDIRVHPDFRRCGIGTKLFNYAVNWALKQGCTQLKVETQNVNLPACRFYESCSCHLGEINQYGYMAQPEVKHEIMLIWYLDL